MKVSELTGAQLDYWVARAGDAPFYRMDENWPGNRQVTDEQARRPVIIRNLAGDLFLEHRDKTEPFMPSTSWAQGGPIIEQERIHTVPLSKHELLGDKAGMWSAKIHGTTADVSMQYGRTNLEASMRAYVASNFGDEVSVVAGE